MGSVPNVMWAPRFLQEGGVEHLAKILFDQLAGGLFISLDQPAHPPIIAQAAAARSYPPCRTSLPGLGLRPALQGPSRLWHNAPSKSCGRGSR
jgi:hypothetical protein